MAPVCVACRLPLSILVFVVFLSIVTQDVYSLLTYDRQTLLELQEFAVKNVHFSYSEQKPLPPLLAGIPAHLYRVLDPTSRRMRRRRRGKRSGKLVKLKACLVRSPEAFLAHCRSVPRLSASWRSLDPIDSCLTAVIGSDQLIQPLRRRCHPQLAWRGANFLNLRPLERASRPADPPAPITIGLVNARSISNKTFILKDFFTSKGLDFLSVTET